MDKTENGRKKMEEELVAIRETLHRAAVKLPQQKGASTGSPLSSSRNGNTEGNTGGNQASQDLSGIMGQLHQLENERKVEGSLISALCCVRSLHRAGGR